MQLPACDFKKRPSSKEIKTLCDYTLEACLKADQRNDPFITITVLFKFNYCLLLLLSQWVLIFLEKPHIGSFFSLKLGSYFDTMGLFSLIGQDGFLQGGDDGNSQGLQGACGT